MVSIIHDEPMEDTLLLSTCHRPSSLWTLLFLGLALAPTPGFAQVEIADGSVCSDCISLDTILRVGSIDGADALPGIPSSVIVDSRDRYWFLLGFNRAPLVVSADGGSVASVGRTGEGPGEFRAPAAAVAVGDSVAVHDPRLNRLTVLDAELSVVRTVKFPDPRPERLLVIDWPDAVLAAGAGRGSDIVGWPLHVVDVSGADAAVVRSMGDGDGAFRPGMSEFHLKRRVAQASGPSFWSTRHYGAYEILRWTREGNVVERFVRSPEWFPDGVNFLMGSRETPPKPAVVGVHEYRDRHLISVLKVASPDWKEAWADTPDRSNEASSRSGFVSVPASSLPRDTELYQVMIEVIDLEGGTVRARTTLPGLPIDVLADGTVAVYGETDIGVPYLDIVRVDVVAR